jgi:cytochrome c5
VKEKMNTQKHFTIFNLIVVIMTVLFLSACALFAAPVGVTTRSASPHLVPTIAPASTTAFVATLQPTFDPASVSTSASATDTPAASATLDGKALLEQRCNVCHSLDYIYQSRGTPDQWAMLVQQMIANGAQLNSKEEKVLVQYLGQTYNQ